MLEERAERRKQGKALPCQATIGSDLRAVTAAGAGLGLEGAGEQAADRIVDGRAPMKHCVHSAGDRHLDPESRRQRHDGRRAGHAFSHRLASFENGGRRLATAERAPEGVVARLIAGAGQHEIAEAREPGEGLRPRALGAGKPL